ncbi:hypothetical protein DICA0_B09472 [Diutina catenulata]
MSESTFVKTYLNLVTLSSDKPTSEFYSTTDYAKLTTLGPSLPLLKFPFPKASDAGDSEAEKRVSVSFKSIKPPFKFSAELEVPVSLSVHRVKQLLIAAVPSLTEGKVEPHDLKVLIKSKVASDSSLLSAVVPEDATAVSATVMVSAPKPVETKAAAERFYDPEVSPVVTDATWKTIAEALAKDIGADAAGQLVAKFKTVA